MNQCKREEWGEVVGRGGKGEKRRRRKREKNCKSGKTEDSVAIGFFCFMQFVNTTTTHKGSGPADSFWFHRKWGIQQQ